MHRKSNRPNDRSKPTQVTNWRLLACTIVVLVIAIPLVYFWHQACISRMGESFSARAAMATKLAKQREEIDSLSLTQGDEVDSSPLLTKQWESFDAELARFDTSLSEKGSRPSAQDLWGMASKYLEMHKLFNFLMRMAMVYILVRLI